MFGILDQTASFLMSWLSHLWVVEQGYPMLSALVFGFMLTLLSKTRWKHVVVGHWSFKFGTFCFLAYLTVAVAYTILFTFSGVVPSVNEADMISKTALFLGGAPLYHDIDDVNRYSLLYGPVPYLYFAAASKLFGVSLTSIKISSTVLYWLGLFSLFQAFKNVHGIIFGVLGVFFAIALTQLHHAPSFYTQRADLFVFTLVCMMLWIVSFMSASVLRAVTLAALLSLLVNTKFTAAVYALPFLMVLFLNDFRHFAVFGISLGAFLLAPFSLAGVDAINYLNLLAMAGSHPLDSQAIIRYQSFDLLLIVLQVASIGMGQWPTALRNLNKTSKRWHWRQVGWGYW